MVEGGVRQGQRAGAVARQGAHVPNIFQGQVDRETGLEGVGVGVGVVGGVGWGGGGEGGVGGITEGKGVSEVQAGRPRPACNTAVLPHVAWPWSPSTLTSVE